MYINPFVLGVIATIAAEFIMAVVVLVVMSRKGK